MRDPKEKVVVAFLHPSLVHGDFAQSLLHLLQYDNAMHRRIIDGGSIVGRHAGANLSKPRNEVAKGFLDFGLAEWLLLIDSDMVFTPDVVERLLEYADPDQAPIVGGLCFQLDEVGDVVPTLFDVTDDNGEIQFIRYNTWPQDSMFQVAATGTGCLMIHKSALERIRDVVIPEGPRAGQRGFNAAFPWFQETQAGDRYLGEDITFCIRAGQCGIPIFVNTSVAVGHIKNRLLTVDSYLLQRGMLAPSHTGAQL